MKKYISVLLMLTLITGLGSALAVKPAKPTNPLYETLVPATGAEPQDQPKLIQQGFKEVLVKLTGSEKILTQPTIEKATREVDKYVSQFGYQLSSSQERLLRVRFDEGLTNQLLQALGKPILNKKQPSVVIWLVTQQENNTQWVEDQLITQWQTLAVQRGLPLIFPLLDLTDAVQVSEQSVWAEDLPCLQTATKRYNTDCLLIGKLNKQPSGWYTQWTLVKKQGEPKRWETSYVTTDAMVEESLEALVARLAESEPDLKEEGEAAVKIVQLSVSGVSGVEDYTKVLDYLKSVPQVREVEVTEINALETIFNIKTTANQEQMIKSIGLGQLLVQSSSAQSDRLQYKMAIENTE